MTTTASSTITALVVENKRQNLVVQRLPWEPQKYVFTIVDTFDRIQLLCCQCEIISLSNATKSELVSSPDPPSTPGVLGNETKSELEHFVG